MEFSILQAEEVPRSQACYFRIGFFRQQSWQAIRLSFDYFSLTAPHVTLIGHPFFFPLSPTTVRPPIVRHKMILPPQPSFASFIGAILGRMSCRFPPLRGHTSYTARVEQVQQYNRYPKLPSTRILLSPLPP